LHTSAFQPSWFATLLFGFQDFQSLVYCRLGRATISTVNSLFERLPLAASQSFTYGRYCVIKFHKELPVPIVWKEPQKLCTLVAESCQKLWSAKYLDRLGNQLPFQNRHRSRRTLI
jgi:hypothetical protein